MFFFLRSQERTDYVLIREIEKEGFIKFEDKNKNKEISKEEYDMIIHETYINNLRYGNGKVNSILPFLSVTRSIMWFPNISNT